MVNHCFYPLIFCMKVAQFLPYFPPHKWWLETVAEEFSKYFISEWCGDVLNVTFWVWQKKWVKEYKKDWYKVLVIPAFDIIPNYPVPKFWTRQYWSIINEVKKRNPDVIQTHTRFFISSFLWWWCSRRWKKKWVHIEHGSDYIQVSSWFTNKVAYIYDRIIWKWVFKKASFIVPISNACRRFIEKEFWRRKNVQVIYRWLDIPNKLPEVEDLHKKFKDKIIVWFIWRLYKWKNVESLIKSYYDISKDLQNKIQIVVIWDWEDSEYLKSLDKENKVYFTWWKPFLEALAYQKQFDIHMHTSNPWWGLATTLLQAMYFWCLIVATPNEWATDVLVDWENAIVLNNSSLKEIKRWLEEWIKLIWKKDNWINKNKQIIEKQFQWKNNIKEFFNIYNN
jgi:glycosyltransferase involved in cell wall biosynthesis